MSNLVLLAEATVSQILNELGKRFEELPEIPVWASPVLIAVAAYYQRPMEIILTPRRNDETVKLRFLCISLLANMNPHRTQGEITGIFGLGHEMYRYGIAKTEERIRFFPEFREEVAEIVRTLNASVSRHAHCRTSPQGTTRPESPGASQP